MDICYCQTYVEIVTRKIMNVIQRIQSQKQITIFPVWKPENLYIIKFYPKYLPPSKYRSTINNNILFCFYLLFQHDHVEDNAAGLAKCGARQDIVK